MLHHLLGQGHIKVASDEVGVATIFMATICNHSKGGREVITLLGGRSADVLVREQAKRKVKKRTCIRDWSKTPDTASALLSSIDFVRGQMTGKDPSYAVLGLEQPSLPGKATALTG